MKTDKEREPRDIKERTFSFALNIVHLAQRLDERWGGVSAAGAAAPEIGDIDRGQPGGGAGGQSRADFSSKYAIALKEAREASHDLRLCRTS